MGLDNNNNKTRTIEVWTDGGCRPSNPGHGSYAFTVHEKTRVLHEECVYCGPTTNNIMELTASIRALEWCIENGYTEDNIYLFTDSQYIQQGINVWSEKWEKRKWKTGNNKKVANQELWKKLIELKNKVKVNFQWVRGHSGHPGNIRVDEMCTKKLVEELEKLELNDKNTDKNERNKGDNSI